MNMDDDDDIPLGMYQQQAEEIDLDEESPSPQQLPPAPGEEGFYGSPQAMHEEPPVSMEGPERAPSTRFRDGEAEEVEVGDGEDQEPEPPSLEELQKDAPPTLGSINADDDPRLFCEPDLPAAPLPAHQWNDLRLYWNPVVEHQRFIRSMGATQTPGEKIMSRIQEAIQQVQQVIMAVGAGSDTGFYCAPSYKSELWAPTPEMQHLVNEDPSLEFWRKPGEIKSRLQVLEQELTTRQAVAEEEILFFFDDDPLGLDGRHDAFLPLLWERNASPVAQKILYEGLVKPSQDFFALKKRFDKTGALVRHLPMLHDTFLCESIGPRPIEGGVHVDKIALKPAEHQLTDEGDDTGTFQRVITVELHHLRLTDHPAFKEEHVYISELLDAYHCYLEITNNAKPGLKSRKYYKKVLDSLSVNMEVSSVAHSPLLNQEHERVEALYAESAAVETAALSAMVSAWHKINGERQKITANHGKVASAFQFALVHKHNALEVYTSGKDILDYVPRLERDPHGRCPYTSSEYYVTVLVRTRHDAPLQIVASSQATSLDAEFVLHVNESFQVHMMHDPVELQLQIFEVGSAWGERMVAHVDVPASLGSVLLSEEFRTGQLFTAQYAESVLEQPPAQPADGSQQPQQPAASQHEVKGKVVFKTNWTTASGLSVEKIQDMFITGEADPLDPRNSALMGILAKHYEQELTGASSEGLGVAGSATPFHTAEEGFRDTRLRTLNKRWKLTTGDLLADNPTDMTLVNLPIPSTEFQTQRVLAGLSATEEEMALDSNAGQMKEWQQKVVRKKKRLQSKKKLLDEDQLAEIVKLPPLPKGAEFFAFILDGLTSWFAPKRKLHPKRNVPTEAIDTKKLADQGGSKVVCHIMSATHLPSRDSGDQPGELFCEVEFIGQKARTQLEDGPSPAWYETVEVDFCPPDFDEGTLSLIEDDIVLTIYDELRIPIEHRSMAAAAAAARDGVQDDITHFRRERRMVGFVRMPFYTVYQSNTGTLNAVLPVEIPRHVFGYRMTSEGYERPSMSVYFSLWPMMCKKPDPEPLEGEVLLRVQRAPASTFIAKLNLRAHAWWVNMKLQMEYLAAENPLIGNRSIEPFVSNFAGEMVLMSRYIPYSGITPPPGIDTLALAARFVSLIPFQVDIVSFADRKDVWSTLNEYLAMGEGDYEEMAVLLVSLLRHINRQIETYLVVGKGETFKEATFVLLFDGVEYNLIDPRTGRMYSCRDKHCGITDVSIVVSHNNVWANMQMSGTPCNMMWDLSNLMWWTPMLEPNNFKAEMECVQPDVLDYGLPATEADAKQIEDALKRTIRDALQRDWRHGKTTSMDRSVSAKLRPLLQDLEQERRESMHSFNPAVTEAHYKIASSLAHEYTLVGVPINVAYVDGSFENALAAVKATAVHEVGGNPRFALGVYVQGYTKSVYSMWVYIVALVINRA